MKRTALLILSTIICLPAWSQKNNTPSSLSHYQGTEASININKSVPESDQISFLTNELLLNEDFTLQFDKSIQSITATHDHYKLFYKGNFVFDGNVHVVTSKDGILKKIIHNQVPHNSSEALSQFPVDNSTILKDQWQAESISFDEKIWLAQGGQLIAARRTELVTENLMQKELIYTDEGVLFQFDHTKHLHLDGPNDTLVQGYVFEPDPLTSAQVNYGGSYVDNSDLAVPVLDNQRKLRSFTASYINNVFHLRNDFAEIQDVSQPSIAPVFSNTNVFSYTRDQSGFEDVNVLYHITNHKTHLDNLGFQSLPGYTIVIDPHGLNGDDNSLFFTGSTPNRLIFGEGGVDDAEDADVIIHEYTHAYIFAASNNNSGITERDCMEESLGDYFAASYSRSINNHNQERVFTWDGHNEFWDGREVESTKDYQQVSFGGNIYTHTDLWASPLMEAYGILGRNAMDQIVMEAIHNLGTNTTFTQMAVHIIDADKALNNGVNFVTLKNAFVRRNILDANYVSLDEKAALNKNYIQLYGTYEFAKGGSLIMESAELSISKVELYDLSGKLIRIQKFSDKNPRVEYTGQNLKSGTYVLHVELENGVQHSFKVSRL